MKKVFLILGMLGFISHLCLAQETAVGVKKSTPAPVVRAVQKIEESKAFSGKIESVSIADPLKGIKSEIVVVNENNQKNTFLVKSTTTIYDADWKAISLDKIAQGQNVKVKYSITKEGINEALSVNVVK